MNFKIKVCGMKDPQNIEELAQLPIHIIGLIFYEKSVRYVGEDFSLNTQVKIPSNIELAGVFVNQSIDYILQKQEKYSLNYLQIHGHEPAHFCGELQKRTQAKIVKAFQIDETFDFAVLQEYETYCDYFLFDTKSNQYGGTGQKYDWNILRSYTLQKPIFLSGGIGQDDADAIKQLDFVPIFSLDLNSKFEIAPAQKNISMLTKFLSNF